MTSRAEIEAVAEEAAERAVDKAMQRWFTTVGIAAGNPRDIQETQADFAWLRGRRRGETKVTIARSEEHTSELQSLMRISYAVFCLKKKISTNTTNITI